MHAEWGSGAMTLITDYNKEWLHWAELFAYLWPNAWLDDLAEMADRMLHTFGSTYIHGT